MIIWQKLLADGKSVAIDKSHSELAEIFLDEDIVYNVCKFEPALKDDNYNGWTFVNGPNSSIYGCLHFLWDKKYITTREYNEMDNTLI